MSATGRGGSRNPDDFYETPTWAVRRFLEKFRPPPGRWLEPGAGTGAIIRAVALLRAADPNTGWGDCPQWTAVEMRHHPYRLLLANRTWIRADFLAWNGPKTRFNFAIGNPPYLLAREFADKCFEVSRITAFLLRLNFAASAERHEWWKEHPADLYILPDRPSYCTKVKCSRCGWNRTLPANAPTPKHPGRCTGKVLVTRTDATEYAWFVWGDGAGATRESKVVWLDRTPASERRIIEGV